MATKKAVKKCGTLDTVAAKKVAKTAVSETVPAKPKKPGKFKIPTKLAEVADLYYTTRDRRLAMEKEAESVKAEEAQLREHLINNLPKSQAGGIAGKLARVEIKKRDVPKLADEKKFMKFAKKPGNEDLVKETMVVSAVQQRWEAGKAIPGVETFTIVSLSVSKLK